MNDKSSDYCHACGKVTSWRMNEVGWWVCCECERRDMERRNKQQRPIVGRVEPSVPRHKHNGRRDGEGW